MLKSEVIKYGKGEIEINHLVDRKGTDFERVIKVAKFFAAQGEHVTLTPKMDRWPKFLYDCVYGSLRGTIYEDKCPDLKIGDLWYEHEGFVTENAKRAFSNMMNHGLAQSDRVAIDRPSLTERYMRRGIMNRIKDGAAISEVWILNSDGTLTLLYKKTDG